MSDTNFKFDREIAFVTEVHQSVEFDAFLREAPAKWVVYLMSDAENRPVQLLCVKNLRYSLKRRLGLDEAEVAPPSRRVNYREIVRKICWRRVDSAFEADAVYLEAAREFFPRTYQSIIGNRPAWFVHVDPQAEFPRYTRTIDLSNQIGALFGPIEDRSAAAEFIEDIEDWFDLCRYYHILTQAPHGLACAYKEMGKCPAPCDGSISMEQYRRVIEWSTHAIVNPADLIREQTARMKLAAAELRFEVAAKIKAYIESLSTIGKGALRHVRRLRDFQFLSIQPGPRDGCAKVFLITPGTIEEIAGIPLEPSKTADLMRLALDRAGQRAVDSLDAVGAERVGVVAHHLFSARSQAGTFLPLETIDERAIVKAYRDVQKQKKGGESEGESEDEGVVKEIVSGR